jgi:segregation and condensation protein B
VFLKLIKAIFIFQIGLAGRYIMRGNDAGQKATTTAIIEAALFLSHEPLPLDKLGQICGVSLSVIRDSLQQIKADLARNERGLVLLETSGGFQLGTKPETAACVEKLFSAEQNSSPLSQAALETLAIIAAKQPVTRLEIENIRGVKADGVIENMLKRGLIRITGRKEGLGRPLLYGITENFMHYFGIKNSKDLEELIELDT